MPTAWFWVLAALMLMAALVLILRPLLAVGAQRDTARKLASLRQAHAAGVLDEAEYASKLKALAAETEIAPSARTPLWLVLGVAIALPLVAVALYFKIGNPRAIDAPSATSAAANVGAGHSSDGTSSGPEMEKAVAGLAEKLKNNPDDLEGWLLLGRAYKNMQRFADALDAVGHALKLAPDNPDVMVDYAEALALSSPEHRIEGEARSLIDKVRKADPRNQRALWLTGIAEAQAERYPQAVNAWETLLPMLEADSEIATSVRGQIAEARKRAGMPPAVAGTPIASTPVAADRTAPAAAPSSPSSASAGGAKLVLKIDLAPELKSKVSPTDVLYVFARAAQGPKMPLAIQRLTAADLPATVTLTDGMGMTPTMQLSSAAQVVVGARISKSGVATPSSGDLQILSAPIDTKSQTAPIVLTINEVVL